MYYTAACRVLIMLGSFIFFDILYIILFRDLREVCMFRRFIAATMIGALALTTGCGLHNPFTSKAEPVTYESVAQSELSPEEKVDKLVANMSDADKVGQLLMIGIHGTTLNDDAKFMLNEYRVGGHHFI